MTIPANPVDPAVSVRVRRVALSGEIDVATAPKVLADVIAVDPSPGDVVTLDLGDVEFIDSRGVVMLLKAQTYIDGMGCQLTLANPSDPVKRVLEVLGLTEQFPFEGGDRRFAAGH
jgi:anti-sigma B factor antagonist